MKKVLRFKNLVQGDRFRYEDGRMTWIKTNEKTAGTPRILFYGISIKIDPDTPVRRVTQHE